MTTLIDVPPGLSNVAVAATTIGDVVGEEGYFHYRGRSAVDLARTGTFEEARDLVLGRPAAWDRSVPEAVYERIAGMGPFADAVAGLRAALAICGDEFGWRALLDQHRDERFTEVAQLAAVLPTLVGALWRASHGLDAVRPDSALGHSADYLRMLTGQPATAEIARAVEQYLMLTIDHGFNASTFTARVVASTGADIGSVVTAALGALSGPLHGSAPGRVLDLIDGVASPDRAQAWVESEVAAGRRVMGFGPRGVSHRGPKDGAAARGGRRTRRVRSPDRDRRCRGRGDADAAATEAAATERRVVRGDRARPLRCPAAPVYADVRGESCCRLGGTRA